MFDQAVERDVLCRTEGGDVYIGQVWPGSTAFPDFVTEEARAWWGELNAAHVQSGLAGIWNDMNEPATGAIPPERMRFDHGRYSHERFHNQYALLMAMGTTAGLRDAMPDLRTFVLSRAGFAGIQRYAANWMGDNLARWDHLWLSIPMAMGFGVSGQPFVGADIGGFHGRHQRRAVPALDAVRHAHALLPQPLRDRQRRPVRVVVGRRRPRTSPATPSPLRYRLLPYIYAAFVRASETGAPVQRPLVFDHQYDAAVRDIDDEYLFGPDLLVAPVVAAGQTARQVYLPAGDWYDWHTDEAAPGRRGSCSAATPMDRIPIYARGGAVIPMWPEAPASTSGHHPRAIELHVFVPRSDGTYESMLQEDDGLTIAALDGARYRTTFAVTRRGDRVTLDARVEGDGYPEFAREAFHLVVHGAEPGTTSVIANSGQDFTVELDV